MNRERDVFVEALSFAPGEERQAFLLRECAGDSRLLAGVQSLLEAHEGVENDFLERTPSFSPRAASSELPLAPGISREGPGMDVGRYRLLEVIGEGGFGVVYMAEQREPVRRKVALKIIKLGMDTRQVVARFEAERQALALMDHPNIAKVLDAGATETGRPYFVMELVRGTPITRFCDETEASTPERLQLFIDVCAAIQHAHQKGIIHRDIKPNNVLVTMHDDRPVVKVIDFGIAKAMHQELTDKTVFTRYHEMLGTPAYMSPEQAELNGLDIDTRSDIYALGVLLYELLTGETPFDVQRLLQAGYDELRRTIREVEPQKPSTRLNTLSVENRSRMARQRKADPRHVGRLVRGDLDWIVMKALEKDRTRRYESASAFAQDIRCHLANEPVSAVAPSVAYRLRKFARRHRTAIPVAAGIVLLLLTGSLVSTWLAARAIHAEETAQSLLQTEKTARAQLERLLVQLQEARQQESILRQRADEHAARAQAEAASAAAVSRFVNEDLFSLADPANEPRREVTLRVVMDRAARQLPGALSNQPLALAAVHTTIGSAYANLGRFDSAGTHLRKAHELYQAELGPSDRTTLEALMEVSGTLEKSGQTLLSFPLAAEAWKLSSQAYGTNDLTSLRCLSGLAWNAFRLRRRPEAFEYADLAWEVAQTLPGSPETEIYPALYLRARSLARKGDFGAGEELLIRGLKAHEARFGHSHVKTLRPRNNLGVFYYDHRRKLDEAERLFLECLHANIDLVGEDHEFNELIRRNLMLVYSATGRNDAALKHGLSLLEFNPRGRAVADDVVHFISAAPMASLERVAVPGTVQWRYTTSLPPAGWQEVGFDDSTWNSATTAPPVDGPIWIRCRCEFAAPPPGRTLIRVEGESDCGVALNGEEVIRQWGITANGVQVAVIGKSAPRTIGAGPNVLAFRVGGALKAPIQVAIESP